MAFNIMDLFGPMAQNRLLQPQQSAQGVQNMLLSRPPPQNYPVAGVPAAPAIDPQTVAAVQGPAAPMEAPVGPQVVQAGPVSAVPEKPGGMDQFTKDMFRENLNQFFLGMATGRTPSESLAMGAAAANSKHNGMKNANQTVAWLQSKGVGKEEAWQIATNPTVLSEYLKDMLTTKKPLEVNGRLLDPDTYKVLADFSNTGDKDTSLIRELKAAGLQEGTPEFQEAILANNRPKGMMIESDGQGGFRMVQGTDVSGGANLNVEQGKNTGFLIRANDANKTIGNLESQGTSLWNSTAGKVPVVGNYALGADAQKYDQAKRDFVNAVLRQESGAVISDQEFANAERQYFPQPGDSDEVIKQKRQNRDNAIQGFRVRSGPGAQSVDKMQAPSQDDPLGIR